MRKDKGVTAFLGGRGTGLSGRVLLTWLLGLGWARQGRARGGQRIAGINSTDAAWYGGLKDRVEKDIEWVASWKTEYCFNASSVPGTIIAR